jgi:hypothetical protein
MVCNTRSLNVKINAMYKMWFLLGEGGKFIMFLVMGEPNGPLEKNNHQNICALGCITINWINYMNHNKYLNSCKSLDKKMVMNEVKNKSSIRGEMGHYVH